MACNLVWAVCQGRSEDQASKFTNDTCNVSVHRLVQEHTDNSTRTGMQSCDMVHKYIGVCSNRGTGMRSMACAAPTTYRETVCQEELTSLKNCLVDDTDSSYPLVRVTDDNELAEEALSAVDQIATQACAAEVKPFLCLYFLGLCDAATELSYQPSASHCKNIRDNICMREWSLAVAFGLDLPDCDVEFSDVSVPCNNHGEEKGINVPLFTCT